MSIPNTIGNTTILMYLSDWETNFLIPLKSLFAWSDENVGNNNVPKDRVNILINAEILKAAP